MTNFSPFAFTNLWSLINLPGDSGALFDFMMLNEGVVILAFENFARNLRAAGKFVRTAE